MATMLSHGVYHIAFIGVGCPACLMHHAPEIGMWVVILLSHLVHRQWALVEGAASAGCTSSRVSRLAIARRLKIVLALVLPLSIGSLRVSSIQLSIRLTSCASSMSSGLSMPKASMVLMLAAVNRVVSIRCTP
jgi:hypothetical protein